MLRWRKPMHGHGGGGRYRMVCSAAAAACRRASLVAVVVASFDASTFWGRRNLVRNKDPPSTVWWVDEHNKGKTAKKTQLTMIRFIGRMRVYIQHSHNPFRRFNFSNFNIYFIFCMTDASNNFNSYAGFHFILFFYLKFTTLRKSGIHPAVFSLGNY
jgi:hypothetical protein